MKLQVTIDKEIQTVSSSCEYLYPGWYIRMLAATSDPVRN